MKKGLSIREKVLLCILGIMLVILAYYYVFYMPAKNAVEQYEQEFILVDDQIIQAEAKTMLLNKMTTELNAIKDGEAGTIKELPAYDNRQNLLVQLSGILANAENYSVNFGGVVEDEVTVTRTIELNYSCVSYDAAKAILLEIYNGEYPCTFTNLFISNEGKTVSVNVIYYEYK